MGAGACVMTRKRAMTALRRAATAAATRARDARHTAPGRRSRCRSRRSVSISASDTLPTICEDGDRQRTATASATHDRHAKRPCESRVIHVASRAHSSHSSRATAGTETARPGVRAGRTRVAEQQEAQAGQEYRPVATYGHGPEQPENRAAAAGAAPASAPAAGPPGARSAAPRAARSGIETDVTTSQADSGRSNTCADEFSFGSSETRPRPRSLSQSNNGSSSSASTTDREQTGLLRGDVLL